MLNPSRDWLPSATSNFGALGLIILAFVFFIAEVFVASYGLLSVAGICALVFGSLFSF